MLCLLLIIFSSAHGQDQERKLLDRLLKPDTTLQNRAQNKKFAANRTSVNKRAPVGTFYFEQKSAGKSYREQRVYSAGQFNSRSLNGGNLPVLPSQKRLTAAPVDLSTRTRITVRHPQESSKRVTGKTYSGNRPFLERGKSQESLSQQDTPLTVEQVRELLNKNK
jgi:hypothetical protein